VKQLAFWNSSIMLFQGRLPIRRATTRMSKRYSILIKATLLLLIAGCTLLSHGACVGPPALEAQRANATADTYAALGNWFGEHKKLDCAADAFRSALKLEPGSAEFAYLLGLTLYSSNDPVNAIEPLQTSIELRPEVLRPHLLLAAALEAVRQGDTARKEWIAALQIDPKSAVALDGLSKSFLATREYGDVIQLLATAPHTEALTINLAQAYAESKNTDAASALLTEALKQHPASLPLSKAMTTLLVNQAHFSDAAKLAEKAVRLHPGNINAEKMYLHVLVLNDEVTTAVPLAHKLLRQAPHDFDALYLNGVLERESAHLPVAKKYLEEAIQLNPDHYNSQYNLGVVLAELNDPEGAREHLQRALDLGAREPQVHFKLAAVLRTLGETDKAAEELKIYQREFKRTADRTLAVSKAAQGDKELSGGDGQKAAGFFREASAASPEDPLLSYKLSVALDRAGDLAGERAALEQTIKLDPDFAIAQNQLGFLSSRDGDAAAAEKYFREALRAEPRYTQAWISLAATLGMQSRIPEAREAIAHALELDPQNAVAIQLNKDLSTRQSPQ
jgi:tetratricopeptide (TPR) repeat protein